MLCQSLSVPEPQQRMRTFWYMRIHLFFVVNFSTKYSFAMLYSVFSSSADGQSANCRIFTLCGFNYVSQQCFSRVSLQWKQAFGRVSLRVCYALAVMKSPNAKTKAPHNSVYTTRARPIFISESTQKCRFHIPPQPGSNFIDHWLINARLWRAPLKGLLPRENKYTRERLNNKQAARV